MRKIAFFVGAIGLSLAIFLQPVIAEEKHREAAVMRELFEVELLPENIFLRPSSQEEALESEEKGVGDLNRRWSRIHELLLDNRPAELVDVAFEMMQAHRKTLYPMGDGRHMPAWLLIARQLDATILESGIKARKETLPPIESFSDIQTNMRSLLEHVQLNIYRDDVVPAVAELVEICAASGNYSLALQSWVHLLQVKREIKLESPQVLLTLAKCWDSIGNKAKAKAILDGAKKLYAGKNVRFAGEVMPLEAAVERLTKDIDALTGIDQAVDWPMYWGSGSRASRASGQIGTGVAWRVLTPAVRDMMEMDVRIPLESRHSLPAAVPLTYKGIVYTRSLGSIVAREAATGKILWSYLTPYSYSGDSGEQHYSRGASAEELWNMAIGDGWLVFAPQSSFETQTAGQPAFQRSFMMGFKSVYSANIDQPRWWRGGSEDPERAVTTLSCISNIVSSGQYAYAIMVCSESSTFFLICIEGSTGKIIWKQPIDQGELKGAAVLNYNMFGSGPVVDGPFVYCVTSDGAIRAHDSATGETKWISRLGNEPPKRKAEKEDNFTRRTLDELAKEDAESYDQLPDFEGDRRRRVETEKALRAARVYPRPRPSLALANSCLVAVYRRNNKTRLLTTDRFKADEKWSEEVPDGSIIAAVGETKVYIFSKFESKITAYNLETGKQDWTVTLPEALNRPTLFGKTLLCPTPEALVALDTDTGKTASTTPWADLSIHPPFVHEAVSIVPSEGRIIISTGYEMVALFSKEYEQMAAARAALNPSDVYSLYEIAVTARARKENEAAAANFEKILNLSTQPRQFVPQDLLNKSAEHLAAIYNEQEAYDKALAVYNLDYLEKSFEYIKSLINAGKSVEAAAELIKILNKGTEQVAESEPGIKVAKLPLVLRTMMSLAAGNEAVLSSLSAEERKSIEGLVKAHANNEQVLPQGTAWEMQQSPQAPSFTEGGFCMLSGERLAMVRNGRVEVRDPATGTIIWKASLSMLASRFTVNFPNAVMFAEADQFGSAKGQFSIHDRIDKVNGTPITSVRELSALIAKLPPNTKVKVDLFTKKTINVNVLDSNDHALPWMHPKKLLPVDNGKMLFVFWPGGICRLYSAADGEVKSTFSIGGLDGNVIDIVVAGDRIFATWLDISSRDTNGIGAYDLMTGKEIWSTKYIAGAAVEPFRVIGNQLILRAGKTITVVNTNASDSASAIKRFDMPDSTASTQMQVVAWGEGRFVCSVPGVTDSSSIAFNIDTAAQAWAMPGYTATSSQDQLLGANSIVVVSEFRVQARKSFLKAVKPADGKVLWECEASHHQRSIVAFSDNAIFRVDAGNPKSPNYRSSVRYSPELRPTKIEALDLATGKTKWALDIASPEAMQFIGGKLIVTTVEEAYVTQAQYQGAKVIQQQQSIPAKINIHWINPEDGRVIQKLTMGGFRPPVIYPAGSGYIVVVPTAIQGLFPKFK